MYPEKEPFDDVVEQLNELIQVDYDAVFAFQQAIANTEHEAVQSELQAFCVDHERHVTELTHEVKKLGGQPVERARDFKGFLLEGFTAIRSQAGTAGALKALHVNAQLTRRMYENALEFEFPVTAAEVVLRNFEDEDRHLKRIEEMIDGRYWERPVQTAI